MAPHTSAEKNKNHLHQAWVLQLYKEHERTCWQYGIKLSVPIIEISNSSSTWGSWHPAGKTIKISAKLIELHSWDVVIHLLRHEMAHQVVSEIFSSHDAHGASFHKACEMLGLPREFRGRSGDLPRIMEDLTTRAMRGPHHNLLVKVEKLLALATSGNEHEALLAMEKANALIAKYNIRRLEQHWQSGYDSIIINHRKSRIENYQRKICAILTNHFFVKIILSDLFDAGLCRTHKIIEILGASENVLMASYVYSFLLAQMDSLWRQFQLNHATTGRQKRSYCLGVLDGFAAKLEAQEQKETAGSVASVSGPMPLSVLVCNNDPGLDRFLIQRYPRLSRKKFAAATVHRKEYEAGCRDGRELNLHKGLTHEEGFQGRLLPGQS
ncbi:MAG: DUF2786 domain-containing protein [Deltaproteobacteria bacterium]|nr:DUF2786 domain-containing protein [Deltaproteobacteria bacterium]